jgi:RNA polymerase sigma-54 factor
MEIKQRMEMRRLLAPQLQQSLKILSLPLLELKSLVEEELNNNPFLEETQAVPGPSQATGQKTKDAASSLPAGQDRVLATDRGQPRVKSTLNTGQDRVLTTERVTKKASLQDVLLRQLGMFSNSDEEFRNGQEIIGNIDENGYLKVTLEEIASHLNTPVERIESVLKLIQQFEPAGVAARTASECLLIQLGLANEKDPLILKIVESHLEDVAKKNYSQIARSLKEPLENIEPLIKKILKLNPKPGRNYSTEETQRVIPDIVITEQDEEINLIINNEDIPNLNINETYKEMLKKGDTDPQAKEFLTKKLSDAIELLRAISRRQTTLRRVVEKILEIQQDAIKSNLSNLKPLTFKEVAQQLDMHESTVCRVVMNKYVRTPYGGVIALKEFFSSRVYDTNGIAISSSHVKKLIKEIIDAEDKKHPVSDQDIAKALSQNHNLNIARRTVAKYREELKILSTTYRRER